MSGSRPNILILMADQLAPRVLGCHGGPAHTPTIDALAATGVVFDDAWCNSPLCTPSRAVMMTGLLPSRTGAYDNAADYPASVPTFAHHLRAAGYRTVLSGKMHFTGPDQLHGFEERLTTDIYPAALGWTPDWTRTDRPEWYHTMDSVTQAGPCVRTNQLDFDEEAVFCARRRLFDIARGNDKRPFCMVVSLTHPHDPFTIPDPWWSRHAEADVPPVAVKALPAGDAHAARLAEVIGLGEQIPTEAQVRAARRAYLGAVSFVDDQFAEVLRTLRETRLDDDTVVIVTADHGEFLGEHGLWFKMSFRAASARVPLIVQAPRRFAPRRVREAVSLVDLLPTLRDLIGDDSALPEPVDGRSLLPHLTGTGGHDEVFGEYLAEGVRAPMLFIRRAGVSFVHSPGDVDQLLTGDETVNLADGSALADELGAEVTRRWDSAALHAAVLASQRRRSFVAAALRQGARTGWDWQPPHDASSQYVREHMPLNDIEAMARFPRVTPPAPRG